MASTRAALDYLQYMHDEFFDDWLLAIAAYNCGEFRVQRESERQSRRRQARWTSSACSLPAETRAYVPKLLAMRRLVANPEDYGIAFSPIPERALLRARRYRRPARPDARRRARRHHAR